MVVMYCCFVCALSVFILYSPYSFPLLESWLCFSVIITILFVFSSLFIFILLVVFNVCTLSILTLISSDEQSIWKLTVFEYRVIDLKIELNIHLYKSNLSWSTITFLFVCVWIKFKLSLHRLSKSCRVSHACAVIHPQPV